MTTTRACSKCGIEKDLETGFYRKRYKPTSGRKDGTHSSCKECMKQARRKQRTCFNCGSSYFHAGSSGARRRICDTCYEIGRVCPGCETFKPWDRMYGEKDKRGPAYCRDGCASAQERVRLYGVGRETYDAMIRESGNRCPCCGRTDRKLVVDHDHSTGAFRGLLCGPCNSGLGLFGDSIASLEGALAYLRASSPGI